MTKIEFQSQATLRQVQNRLEQMVFHMDHLAVDGTVKLAGAWTPSSRTNSYLQLNLGILARVYKIGTKGANQPKTVQNPASWWVTSYKVQYLDSTTGQWTWYQNSQSFVGNNDADTLVTRDVIPFVTSKLRIYPTQWKNEIGLRAYVHLSMTRIVILFCVL